MLLDQATTELVVAIPTGSAKSEISGVGMPPGEGFGAWAVENCQPLLVEDASRDNRGFADIAGSRLQIEGFVLRGKERTPASRELTLHRSVLDRPH